MSIFDLDEEYIESLYDDALLKEIIRVLSDDSMSNDERIKLLVEYMERGEMD